MNSSKMGAWAIDVPLLNTALNMGLKIGEIDIEFKERWAAEDDYLATDMLQKEIENQA